MFTPQRKSYIRVGISKIKIVDPKSSNRSMQVEYEANVDQNTPQKATLDYISFINYSKNVSMLRKSILFQ